MESYGGERIIKNLKRDFEWKHRHLIFNVTGRLFHIIGFMNVPYACVPLMYSITSCVGVHTWRVIQYSEYSQFNAEPTRVN